MAGFNSGLLVGQVALFTLCVLAVTRITRFITAETGPFRFMERIRARVGALGETSKEFIECPACISVWAALPFAAYTAIAFNGGWLFFAAAWPALSMLTIWLLMERG